MSNTKKVNTVLHIITGLGDGGAEGVLSRICLYSKNINHEVISLMDEGKYGVILSSLGLKVHCLNMSSNKPSLFKFIKLIKLIRSIDPDIVQTWMYHSDLLGGLASKFAGIKNIYWGIRHSTLEKEKTKALTILIAKICALLSSWIPNKIICCANKALQTHADLGYKKEKLVVIHNGYDLSKFRLELSSGLKIRKEFSIDRNIFLIGNVSRYEPVKDHSNLLQALSLLVKNGINFRCILVGKGLSHENTQLINEINKLDLSEKIILAGQRSDISSIMNALDLHVLSSSSEGFPNVIAESMACGTPCVSTNVGDALEIINNSSLICPPKNPIELSKKINNMYKIWTSRKEEWDELKFNSIKNIEKNFSIKEMINSYESYWLR